MVLLWVLQALILQQLLQVVLVVKEALVVLVILSLSTVVLEVLEVQEELHILIQMEVTLLNILKHQILIYP
jgi:hypothetical protein